MCLQKTAMLRRKEIGKNWTGDKSTTLLFLLVLVIWQTSQIHVASPSFVLKVSDYLLVNFCSSVIIVR